MQDKFSIADPLGEIFSNYSDLIPPIEPFIANMAEMFLECFSTKYLVIFFCVLIWISTAEKVLEWDPIEYNCYIVN